MVGLALLIFAEDPLYKMPYGVVIYWIFTALFLFLLLFTQVNDVKKPFDLGKSNFLVWMGKYTYGLYMYHRIAMFIIDITIYKFFKLEQSTSLEVASIVFTFIIAWVLTYLSYRFVEKRFLHLKDKFSHFKKPEDKKVLI